MQRILAIVLCLTPSIAIAGDSTRISIDYGVLAIFAPPGGPSGVAKHHLTITLNTNKQVDEEYAGGGRNPRSGARNLILGAHDNQRARYDVIDENTIRRV